MKPLVLSLLVATLALPVSGQTPATPTKVGTAATGTAAAASGTATAPAKPASISDKKFIKDVSGAILIEQKILGLLTDDKATSLSETTKRDMGRVPGELKRMWTALATLATAKGADVAQDVSKSDLATVEKLKKEKPEKFVKELFDELAKETKKKNKIFESAKMLQDPEIKRYAEDWATVVKGHEVAMEKAGKSLGKK